MQRDPVVQSAIDHWAPRFVANGVPLSDFEEVAAAVLHWDEWCGLWCERGDRHAALGDAALAEGRRLSAGEHLSTAAACYHFGKFLFVHRPDEMRAAHAKAVACRTRALPLLRPPGERLEIPFEGGVLAGNLRRPEGVDRPPLVLMAMGLDSAKEEMHSNEAAFLDRGMATFAFDGPGQGEAEYDLPICPEYERPVGAILDVLSARADIDAARIGIWGVSFGGYYAPRAAAFDDRLRACISLSGPFDWADIFETIPGLTRRAFVARAHAASDDEARAVAARVTLAEAAPRLACPLYIVVGGQDRIVPPEHGDRLARLAGGEVTLNRIEDGNHVANNRAFAYRTQAADWMAHQLGLAHV